MCGAPTHVRFTPESDINRDVWNVRDGQWTLGSPRPKGRLKIRWVKLSVVFFRDMLAKATNR
jgi:hypothetical protein